jgi:hypothetical protein
MLEWADFFSHKTLKAQEVEATKQMELNKTRHFCAAKKRINRMKR